ncbi:MAG: outer membrane beta-barrel protein [Gemmatimonadaceae bacterium]
MKIRHIVALSALVATAHVAHAQVSAPIKFSVFAGGVIPTGDGSDQIKVGYTAGVALDLKVPTTQFGFRAEGLYASFDSKQQVSGFDAKFTDLGVNANGVLWFPMSGPSPVSPYITAGPSFSHIKAEAKSGSTTISDSENKFGFNVGGGLEFGLGTLGARVDVRYKRISQTDGSYQSIPITFALRF